MYLQFVLFVTDYLECLSHWEEDGKQYMIARTQPFGSHTPVANCFVSVPVVSVPVVSVPVAR